MEIVNRNVDELKHVEGNTRLHSKRQLKEYVRSIEMFGQIRPLVIDENNVVLAGNGLLAAMRMMGATTVACHVVTGLSEKQKKKLMLADNKIFQLGEDDTYAFEEALRELSGDIDIPGYSADILKSLTSDLKTIDNLRDETAQSAEKKNARRENQKPQANKSLARIAAEHLFGSNHHAQKSKATLPIQRLPKSNGFIKRLLPSARKGADPALRQIYSFARTQ